MVFLCGCTETYRIHPVMSPSHSVYLYKTKETEVNERSYSFWAVKLMAKQLQKTKQ